MLGKVDRDTEPDFDLPQQILLVERRRSGLARAAWQAAGNGQVTGFEDYSLIVDDPGGQARMRQVGQAVTETFGLVADVDLVRQGPIAIELCAACDLLSLDSQPVEFEASLMAPGLACILLRGVALPIENHCAAQIVLSWREVLNRTATARLERELVAELRASGKKLPRIDPFSSVFGKKRLT